MPSFKQKNVKDIEKEIDKLVSEKKITVPRIEPKEPVSQVDKEKERRSKAAERKRIWRAKQKTLKMQTVPEPISEPLKAKPSRIEKVQSHIHISPKVSQKAPIPVSAPLKEIPPEIKALLPEQEPEKKERKHFRIRIRKKRRPDKVIIEKLKKSEPEPEPEPEPEIYEPDVSTEQKELPMTTIYCPESIKENELSNVKRNPENYVEINMIKKTRVVDAYYIKAEQKKFHYKNKEYQVKEDSIYLLPTKTGMFMPTCYYHEGSNEPTGFKQTNKGITGKALSLLYMEQLYTSLLYSEDLKYNFFIVILSIASLIAYGIGCYFVFFHNGGMFSQPAPAQPAQDIPHVISLIRGFIYG